MSKTAPAISNADCGRFLFGTFALVDGTPVFHGSVIYGRDLTYDSATGLPIRGTVNRIELQTRSDARVLEVHHVLDGVNSEVPALNKAAAARGADWFDPQRIWQDDPSNDTADGGDAHLDDDGLHLETGDTLTTEEIFDIFAGQPAKGRRTKVSGNDISALQDMINSELIEMPHSISQDIAA